MSLDPVVTRVLAVRGSSQLHVMSQCCVLAQLYSKADGFFFDLPVTNSPASTMTTQNGETTSAPLFGTIGEGAEEINNLDDEDGQMQSLVDEIESMCINCEENVGCHFFPVAKFRAQLVFY